MNQKGALMLLRKSGFNSRNSNWRITFAWVDEHLTDAQLGKIEVTDL